MSATTRPMVVKVGVMATTLGGPRRGSIEAGTGLDLNNGSGCKLEVPRSRHPRPWPGTTALNRGNVRNNPAVVLVAVLLSSLSLPITLTGASVALPDIATDLHAN